MRHASTWRIFSNSWLIWVTYHKGTRLRLGYSLERRRTLYSMKCTCWNKGIHRLRILQSNKQDKNWMSQVSIESGGRFPQRWPNGERNAHPIVGMIWIIPFRVGPWPEAGSLTNINNKQTNATGFMLTLSRCGQPTCRPQRLDRTHKRNNPGFVLDSKVANTFPNERQGYSFEENEIKFRSNQITNVNQFRLRIQTF